MVDTSTGGFNAKTQRRKDAKRAKERKEEMDLETVYDTENSVFQTFFAKINKKA